MVNKLDNFKWQGIPFQKVVKCGPSLDTSKIYCHYLVWLRTKTLVIEHKHPLNSILIELMKRILDLQFLIIGKDFNMNYEHLHVNNSHNSLYV